MKERLTKLRADLTAFWDSRTKNQKIIYIATAASVIALAVFLTMFFSKTTYVTLYSEVSPSEIGRIKEVLDGQGVPYLVEPGGTAISVPEKQLDNLRVSLAAEGFPDSGLIDYSFFSDNAGFGTTDNEFNMIKLAAMQTELANLIKGIEGIKDAKVMLTLPTEGIFVNDTTTEASAAIMLKTNPGQKFSEQQITSLYNLVSKSLPNLSNDNIVIQNQYFEYFDLNNSGNSYGANVTDQMGVKKTIERDLQRQVQMMLGTLMGQDKVVVSVTTDIDFTKEQREENLVTPVDPENMEGIALSVQRITESFSGTNPAVGGTPEAEDPTDNRTTYVEGEGGNGDYERLEETINNEVNRIRKDIVESPYKISNIGIQVMIEPPTADDPASLAPEVRQDVERILETIVRTSLDKEAAGELTDEMLAEKIAVSVQPLRGKNIAFEDTKTVIPWWVYLIGGILLLAVIILVILFLRKRRNEAELEEELALEQAELEAVKVDDINLEQETEATARRKQLEKMAKDKPEEFAKLLRTWIAKE
ncbi:flagellar M-ring protein FliF [Sporosarcina sp. P37]|uniref:flagellar basal-body MS-ring/collar protein FliF n=1 Tax=unclassified Sporosarcina TaxID=2647733 RepID=UPI0009C0E536|nr:MULTISPECIES: flagellar basal-body MS-ring/collar protein FliF [unclassified Sporosarcina]ARD49293.1 flagellar M-ring protein FliF [Sporosarcina sp. P33]ARK25766.1 flagellar M-ring protein FliF [Sporosarcina sp. P37]PID19210.1 flagellar basal body M-ring protein FliF [Sporosarcina sp. P35]